LCIKFPKLSSSSGKTSKQSVSSGSSCSILNLKTIATGRIVSRLNDIGFSLVPQLQSVRITQLLIA